MHKRNILFISHIYPPVLTGGTQRVVKFSKSLKSAGHNVFLVTSKNYFPYDVSDEANIFRAHNLYNFLDNRRRQRVRQNNEVLIKSKNKYFLGLIKKYIYIFLCFPDEHFTFIWTAFFRAIKIITRNKIDYIFSTYPSVSNLIVGHYASLIFRKKHIVDLREPWLDVPDWIMRYDSNFIIRFRLLLENFLEKVIINNAHIVILNHRWMLSIYSKKYGNDHKYIVIPNGFDGELIDKVIKHHKEQKSNNINIIYSGSYYLKHQPDYLLAGINKAVLTKRDLNIKFSIFGSIDDTTKENISRYCNKFTAIHNYYVDKETIFHTILSSNLAVISVPPIKWGAHRIPGKIYEYKRLGVPILAIGGENSALEFMAREFNEKFICANATNEISDFIINFIKHRNGKGAAIDHGVIDEYDYTKITNKFVELFQ